MCELYVLSSINRLLFLSGLKLRLAQRDEAADWDAALPWRVFAVPRAGFSVRHLWSVGVVFGVYACVSSLALGFGLLPCPGSAGRRTSAGMLCRQPDRLGRSRLGLVDRAQWIEPISPANLTLPSAPHAGFGRGDMATDARPQCTRIWPFDVRQRASRVRLARGT